jgi:hypothetical protein
MNHAVREWLAEIGSRGGKIGAFSACQHRPRRCEQPAKMAVLGGWPPEAIAREVMTTPTGDETAMAHVDT